MNEHAITCTCDYCELDQWTYDHYARIAYTKHVRGQARTSEWAAREALQALNRLTECQHHDTEGN